MAMIFWATFPGIGGSADASTTGGCFTGFATERSDERSPADVMGAEAKTEVVVVMAAGEVIALDRVGICARADGAGEEPNPV